MSDVIKSLRAERDALIQKFQSDTGPRNPVESERYARAITAFGKAIRDEEEARARDAQLAQSRNTTKYEDLPPPNPEELARFDARLRAALIQLPDLVCRRCGEALGATDAH